MTRTRLQRPGRTSDSESAGFTSNMIWNAKYQLFAKRLSIYKSMSPSTVLLLSMVLYGSQFATRSGCNFQHTAFRLCFPVTRCLGPLVIFSCFLPWLAVLRWWYRTVVRDCTSIPGLFFEPPTRPGVLSGTSGFNILYVTSTLRLDPWKI